MEYYLIELETILKRSQQTKHRTAQNFSARTSRQMRVCVTQNIYSEAGLAAAVTNDQAWTEVAIGPAALYLAGA